MHAEVENTVAPEGKPEEPRLSPREVQKLKAGVAALGVTGWLTQIAVAIWVLLFSNTLLLIYFFTSGGATGEFLMAYSGLNTAAWVLSLLVFMVWFYLAYKNLSLLKIGKPKWSPAYTVIAVVAPLVNLFLPYILMKEIVTKCSEAEEIEYAGKLNWVLAWWLLLIARVLLYAMGGGLLDSADGSISTLSWISLGVISDILMMLSALFLVLIIRYVGRLQRTTTLKRLQTAAPA